VAIITDKTQPSFVHFPLQNNRTALAPVNIPLLLIVPFIRDPITGAHIDGAEVSDLKFFIEEAPGSALVAGFQNAGIFVPDFERFVKLVSTQDLLSVKIDITGLPFFDKTTGELKEYVDAQPGDLFEYTVIRGLVEHSGPRDKIEYLPGADYFDLSPFIIPTIELKPYGTYRFSWQCHYFHRIITPEGEIFCINTNDKRLARFSMLMKHPGEIHQMMIEQTPTIYFDGTSLDKDSLVQFYRPFADALQDMFDEQSLMVGVNFIEKIPAQFIPYLAYLIGWDLPYFPGSTDRIRRAVLRNGRRLQQLKGSKRVIRELFELFGFTIDIVNLWYAKNGSKFVAPGEQHESPVEEIELQEVCQTEVLLANYDTNGFGGIDIPLLFRPDSDITIDAWLVEDGSAAHDQLNGLIDTINIDPEGLMGTVCPATTTGFLISQPLEAAVTASVTGQSKILMTQRLGAITDIKTKDAPLSQYGVKYDFDRNTMTLSFDHYLAINGKFKVFVFATYKRKKIIIPQSLSDLRSNRFDIQILLDRMTGEAPDSHLLDFLLDFIFKLKAFHSILRKIVFTVNVADVYNVTNFCAGGQISQAPGTDLGELQTLPPVIPLNLPGCSEDVFRRGFKDSDFALRDEIWNGLKAEHAAWKALDGTHAIPPDLLPIISSLTRITPNTSTEAVYGIPGINYGVVIYGDNQTCEFTQHGQDRVIAKQGSNGIDKDFDHEVDDREKLCDDTNNVLDNCFKGRVSQELEVQRIIPLTEIVRCRPCNLMVGEGFYYYNQQHPMPVSEVKYGTYSYGRIEYGGGGIDTSTFNNLRRSYLTDLIIRATANTEFVHYTTSPALSDNDVHTNGKVAIRRPSLDIDKDNMFYPGHRFLTMDRLEVDFISSVYTFRPWDDQFDLYRCPETIAPDEVLYGELNYGVPTYGDESISIDDLDPQLVANSNGDLLLVFNDIPYKLYGNGFLPDISSMGAHDERDWFITHSIFTSAPLQPIIDDTIGMLTDTDLTSVCFSANYTPIFESANRNCPCDVSSSFAPGSTDIQGMDFIDGYPSEFGRFIFDIGSFDYPRGASDDIDLSFILGLPSGATTIPDDLLFKLGSGIKVDEPIPQARFYKPFRIDCGCLFFDCGSSDEVVPHVQRCNIELFRELDGNLDFECDKITVNRHMVLEEIYGACSSSMSLFPPSEGNGNQSIANMVSLDPEKLLLTQTGKLPPSGEFFFVDSYGIIHEASFETDSNRVDITFTTRDPRVWNEDPTGSIKKTNGGNRVFRRGTVTTCRTISELPDPIPNQPQFAKILADGCTQEIATFQSTFGCGDKLPKEPFAFHLECGLVDELEIEVNTLTSGGTSGSA
jgi:hypothetical protein